MKPIEELAPHLLQTKGTVVITTHYKPDGDALGSSLALYHALSSLGLQVAVVVPSDFPSFLNFLPGIKDVVNAKQNPRKASKLLKAASWIFMLDFNQYKRVEQLSKVLEEAQGTKILIDHHMFPDAIATYGWSDVAACATCELIYLTLIAWGLNHLIDAKVATCIYTGLVTDTGSFRFNNTRPQVHEIVAKLMQTGIAHHKIHEAIYDSWSYNRLKFLGYCLYQKLTIIPEFKTAYIALTAAEIALFNAETGDTEGLVNYGLSIEGIKFACLITEKEGKIKMSFRSKGSIAVNAFAAAHFNGGGHLNAAGGMSTLGFEKTLALFLAELPGFYATWPE